MAETVKKSRIVSENNDDDNLEEALMEEFNMRLKTCMSQDDLLTTNVNDEEEEEEQEEDKDIGIITNNKSSISRDFIKAEQDNFYEVPSSININDKQQQNGHHTIINSDNDEAIYENVPSPPEQTRISSPESPQHYIDMTSQNTATTYEIVTESNEHYEEIGAVVGPDLTLTDLSESKTEMSEVKSVKDRMFLSTDVQSSLLFTQTVTSPMLTPSEENIDFLKGFQNVEETPDRGGGDDEKSPEEIGWVVVEKENIYENADIVKMNGGDAIYENLKKSNEQEEVIYENLKEITRDEVIYQNLGELAKDTQINEETSIITDEKEEQIDNRLRSIDVMKQISKFEDNDSTTQVTESYVESTVIESNGSDNKGLKKKKTKKSRKEEKENISVNDTNKTINEESYYNVNVKSLCRSFGDLSKIDDDNRQSNKVDINNRTRTKSLSDVTASSSFNKTIENVFTGVSVRTLREKFYANFGDPNNNISSSNNYKSKTRSNGNISVLKSSFNKFDALQKKNVLHVRSSDSSKAQEKFSGAQVDISSNCKACEKAVFQMEQIKAERAVWHKNCFRCNECNKQLNVDTYQSHEGTLYCKPHFKALFAPKAVEDDEPPKPRKPELIIRENQPLELPPDVVRASDKPDLGLEELQSLNVKERFQVFEHHQSETTSELERTPSNVNVKRSPSILSKLAKFQAKGMDIGVADDSLNGIPIEESSSEEDEDERDEDGGVDGEDADLIRAKRVQKEKPFHFTGMSDVKSKWEHQGEQNATKDERREERKQEIQSIRNRLFMGKQGKMKEAYQQAVMESESSTNLKYKEPIEVCDTKSIKEKFEKGELINKETSINKEINEDSEVFESEISKKSRSLFLELDANASKPPQIAPPVATPKMDVKKAREAYLAKTATSEDVVKSSIDQVDEIQVKTADIQERFKFFETYREPEKEKKAFRITPPREGQVKAATPEREIYRDPDIVRSEEYVEDSVIAKERHTATKMLNKFRQMEENLAKEPQPTGPKPLKRFTPPPEPSKPESSSEAESGSEEDDEEEEDEIDNRKIPDGDLLEAQKAARAKQLRAKFERWEANEIQREQNNTATVNIVEEFGEEQSSIESTKTLRQRFESMRETSTETSNRPKVKVNRFVEFPSVTETCLSCNSRVYPLEKISVHNQIYHKKCFKCMECSCVLRMDSYSYNQGLLYCLPHFKRLFISKGNYDTGFGLGQHKEKWNTNATLA